VSRRDLVLLGVLVAVVVAVAALAGRAERGATPRDPRPSTHVTAAGGAAALYWTLQELGLPVARRGIPLVFSEPPREGLALLAPTIPLSPAEVSVALGRARAGGLLVLAGSPRDGDGGAIHDSLGLVLAGPGGRSPRSAGPATVATRPDPWTAGLDSVRGFRALFADTSPALATQGARTLLAGREGVAGVLIPLGAGRVLALSDADPLTNERLRESGAAVLIARAVAASGETLWFDEFHHGFRDDESAATGTLRRLSRVLPTPFWIHLGLLAALALALAGRRFGAPHPPPAAERRSPLEHVEALAGAYRQAGARRTARRLLVAGLARRLGRRIPHDDAGAAETLERVAQGLPGAAAAVGAVRSEWRKGSHGDLGALSGGIDRILDEVRR
jgi:hypothetical protein